MKYYLEPIEYFDECWEEGEVKAIINDIKQATFKLQSEEETRLFLQKHQAVLIFNRNNNKVCTYCEKVLYFLETYFGQYLDPKSPMSAIGKERLFQQCENSLMEAKELLIPILSPQLWHYTNSLLNPRNINCTIERGRYIKTFWENWNTDFVNAHNPPSEDQFIIFLISQNFNAPVFYSYLINKVLNQLEEEDDPFIQEEILERFNCRFFTGPTLEEQSYSSGMQNISELLQKWISLEIRNCRKKQKSFNPSQTTMFGSNTIGSSKIETSFSVAQLAYFIKILAQSGIVNNNNQKELLETVAKCFKTKKVDKISIESLSNKYYNVEDTTKEIVKQRIRQIDKEMN